MRLSLAAALPLILLAGSAFAAAPPAPAIAPGSVLTLAQCLAIADRAHPQVAAAAAAAAVQEARLSMTGTAYRPRLDGSASWSRVSPSSPGADYDQYSAGVTLTQNLYDFGRTRGDMAASRASLTGAREDLDDARARTASGVRGSYFTLLRATRSLDVARGNLAQSERRLAQAKGFFEAGTRPRYDVTRAEVDLANARLSLITAGNAVRLAATSLATAMGVPGAPDFTVEDTLGEKEVPPAYPQALARAFSLRSDLRSLDAAAEASRAALAVAEAESRPSLDGRAGYTFSGQDAPLQESWSAGVTLSVPLYEGGASGYRTAQARASLEGALARREQLRQSIETEVQQAGFNAAEAAERIPTAELAVRQAEENLALANGRYDAGVGSPIEVADAQTALANQKNAHIQALYDYQAAMADLKKAMGER